MSYYDDGVNRQGAYLLFRGVQLLLLLIVLVIVYTSFVAVQYSIALGYVTSIAYLPVFVSPLLFWLFLQHYKKMFLSGGMLRATVWSISMASVFIVLLYLYVDKVSS